MLMRVLSFDFFKTYAAWLLLPLLGVFFGALATTANILIISMALAAFIGIVLLSKPAWNTELVIVLGLFVAGLVPLFFDSLASKAVWGISILGFMLLPSALYRLITTPQLLKSTPLFMWMALLFFLYALLNSIVQFYSVAETVSGFKRYFQVWGLLFGLCWLNVDTQQITRWRNRILAICLLQAPFCLHQLLFLVPIREGYVASHQGLVPVDVVAGTFGAGMFTGGNNAEMATTLIILFAFLLTRYRANLLAGKKLLWLSLLLLSPLAMGETKIIVIFFPLMLAVLYRNELFSRPHYAVAALILGSLFTAIILNVYVILSKMTLDQLIFDTLKYNVYEVGYGNCSLNRTTVLTFWANHQSLADPVSFLFGNGLGSTEEEGALGGGHIDMRYPAYCVGFTGASKLLWELGTLGLGLFLMILLLAWRCAGKLINQSSNPMVRADAAAIQTSLVLFAIYPLYRSSLLSAISFQVIFTALLGYLAWLYKQHLEREL